MANPYFTEDTDNNKDLAAKGPVKQDTGQDGAAGVGFRESVRSYPDGGKHQPRDRSNGVQRCKVYAQDKGL